MRPEPAAVVAAARAAAKMMAVRRRRAVRVEAVTITGSGFALQLGTVRYLGTFLPDPLDVPWPVVEYLMNPSHSGGAHSGISPAGIEQCIDGLAAVRRKS